MTDGTLDINTGSVLTANPGSSIVGDSAGVAGTGMITGKGFALVSTGDVTLGQRGGTGKLIVEDGGSATSKSEILAACRTGGGLSEEPDATLP
jgi:T5SS/PEP-CTERM-associated repeat protein